MTLLSKVKGQEAIISKVKGQEAIIFKKKYCKYNYVIFKFYSFLLCCTDVTFHFVTFMPSRV